MIDTQHEIETPATHDPIGAYSSQGAQASLPQSVCDDHLRSTRSSMWCQRVEARGCVVLRALCTEFSVDLQAAAPLLFADACGGCGQAEREDGAGERHGGLGRLLADTPWTESLAKKAPPKPARFLVWRPPHFRPSNDRRSSHATMMRRPGYSRCFVGFGIPLCPRQNLYGTAPPAGGRRSSCTWTDTFMFLT